MFSERQRGEEGGTSSHGVHSGTEVVAETGQGHLHGARSATGLGFGFEYVHAQTGTRQHNGCRQPVRA
jgi:hypothetical protein